MVLLKHLLLGFAISFLGSIPLGYLNVIGFQVYEQAGLQALMAYLFGVVSVEVFILYFTYKSALFLSKQTQIKRFIELFSIVFLLVLAFVFGSSGTSENHQQFNQYSLGEGSFYLKGIGLNLINLMQIPFWLGWHLYVNQNYRPNLLGRNFYFLGALAGTMLGMLTIVLVLAYFTEQSAELQKYLLSFIVPLFFVLLALYQIFRYRKKYNVN
ncbi:hypothetical protein KIH23_04455 [Flavobacterium sp. CYK-55]|uniref:hypothetical protein n=1 Tax=Flavobacterium sp. CYK-55 TaxID=2835529 RepID=UPI001BCAA9B7|nr:hypothetical protein [Flavobacterium sp. CYK-55]MBS7786541.1 hypothetical protein [Flavobacterium sp. CYK-55]